MRCLETNKMEEPIEEKLLGLREFTESLNKLISEIDEITKLVESE